MPTQPWDPRFQLCCLGLAACRMVRWGPIPSLPGLLSWDDVWIQHESSGTSINFEPRKDS